MTREEFKKHYGFDEEIMVLIQSVRDMFNGKITTIRDRIFCEGEWEIKYNK